MGKAVFSSVHIIRFRHSVSCFFLQKKEVAGPAREKIKNEAKSRGTSEKTHLYAAGVKPKVALKSEQVRQFLNRFCVCVYGGRGGGVI